MSWHIQIVSLITVIDCTLIAQLVYNEPNSSLTVGSTNNKQYYFNHS